MMLQKGGDSGGGGGREVVFRLRLLPDPDSKKQLKAVGDEAAKQQKRIDQSAIASAKQRLSVEQKAAKDSERLLRQETKDKERADKEDQKRREKASQNRLRLQQRAAKEEGRLRLQLAKERQREYESNIRLAERAAKEEQRQREKTAKEQLRLQAQTVREEKKLRLQLAKEKEQELTQNTRLFERSHNQMLSANDQMTERLTSATESVARFGRGFAMLGLIGEENTQKLLQGLVKVQASFDLVVGGVNAYVRLKKAVDAYRTSVAAAATAETALAAIRGRAVAGGVAGAGVGGLGLAAAGAGGAGVVGAGGAIGKGAIGKLAGAATTAAGALATIPVAIAGAVAGVGAVIAQGISFARTGKFLGQDTLTSRLQPGSFGRTAFKSAFGAGPIGLPLALTGQLGRFLGESGLAASGEKGSRMTRGRQGRIEIEGRERLLQERASEIAGIQQQGEERRKQLIMDNLDIEKQITSEKLRGVQESISGHKQALNLTQQRLEQERGGLLSAKERFGQLDREDQQRLIRIKRKADRRGFGALSREERAALRGVGTRGATGIASRGDVAAAERGGFSKFFGGEERDEIARLGREGRQLQINLQDRRELKIEIERNDDAIAKKIAASVVRATKENLPNLIAAVNRETAKQLAEAEQRHQQQTSQAFASRVEVGG